MVRPQVGLWDFSTAEGFGLVLAGCGGVAGKRIKKMASSSTQDWVTSRDPV